MKVLIIHAYSADNRGDGLLVEESLRLVTEVFGPGTEVGLVASYPDSFADLGHKTYRSKPGRWGYDRKYVRLLLGRAKHYDIIVSVGGGFLRGKRPIELMKTVLVNGPQLLMAWTRGKDCVYLPQSIGPFGSVVRPVVRRFLANMAAVWLRDDRSVEEMCMPNGYRAPDLAILGMKRRHEPFDAEAPVVLTVRHLNGHLPDGVLALNRLLQQVDSYIQSDVGANTDTRAVGELYAMTVLDFSELMTENTESRIVVAVRLHAALMALAAGHYVLHLAYERKGFGAFRDLGLEEYVHNINDFSPEAVLKQIDHLRQDNATRRSYDQAVTSALQDVQQQEARITASLRAAALSRFVLPSDR